MKIVNKSVDTYGDYFVTSVSDNRFQVKLDRDKLYALLDTGEINFIETPYVGEVFSKGGVCGNIETVKGIIDIVAPFDCKVVSVNNDDVINKLNAYNNVWIIEIIKIYK
jgi:glycine cleavage system H lipoate-binding protein